MSEGPPKTPSVSETIKQTEEESIPWVQNKDEIYVDSDSKQWVSLKGAAILFDVPLSTLQRYVKEADTPYLVGATGKTKKKTLLFGLDTLKQAVEGFYAPENWQVNSRVSDDLGVSESTVKAIADRYVGTNPEWFRTYKGKSGSFTYYSPELIDIIRKEVNESIGAYPKAPADWVYAKGLMTEVKLLQNTIDEII